MLFNYNNSIKQLFNRKGAYMPGDIAKTTLKQVFAENSLITNSPLEFGTVVKKLYDINTKLPYVTHLEEDDEYFSFYGIAVRDVTSQNMLNIENTKNQIINSYYAGQNISVMTEGYIAVPVNIINGFMPKPGDKVWVRVLPSLVNPNLPIGGIESSGTVGNVAWLNATFESEVMYPTDGTVSEQTPTNQTAIIFIRNNEDNYKQNLTVVSAPTYDDLYYGQSLNNVEILQAGVVHNDDNVEVEGIFVPNNKSLIPNVIGEFDFTCSFIPTDVETYETITNVEASTTILKSDVILNVAPTTSADLYYGDQLSTINLIDGSAKNQYTNNIVNGSFDWTEPNTTPQVSGNQTVDFSPVDSTKYNDVIDIGDVYVTVVKVPIKVLTEPSATNVTSGNALSTSTISGGVVCQIRDEELVVDGAWAWEDGTEIITETGSHTAIFTPTNANKYPSDLTVEILVTVE